MGKSSFKDSLKALEADIQHANTLALDFPREKDGGRLQMRLSYTPAAHFLLGLFKWADCHLVSALGLLRILVYLNYADGESTMSVFERRATVKEFYAVIFPSLLQLQRGVTDLEDEKQRDNCADRYGRREELSEFDVEREAECGICMETDSKVVLPNCCHALCLQCYRDWQWRSKSCPFCRDSLKRVDSGDLWFCTDDVDDLDLITRQNCKRLFMYIDNLPLIVRNDVVVPSALALFIGDI